MSNPQKSWKGAPTFNASLQDGQNDVNPWGGDGAPTALGIEPNIRFRGRKVAKFLTGTSGNCYLNGAAKLSTGTNSTVWTSTFYLKRVDGTALSSVGMYQYITGNTNVNTTVSVTAVEDGWYKAVYTRSGLVAGYPTLTGMFSLGAATQYYFADWQCENISISSPWVSGTRSNTQAILDLTSNNTVTATSLTYASDGTFSFNGSTNHLTCGNNPAIAAISGTTAVSVEAWVNLSGYGSTSGYGVITHKGNPWAWLMENPSNRMRIRFGLSVSGDVSCADSSTHALNTWYQFVGTYDGFNMRFYRNGVLTNTVAASGTLGGSGINMVVGNFSGAYYSQGQIPIVKIYNRTLTNAEVQQNFNALRGRYGL
jgi:hypothetical protein